LRSLVRDALVRYKIRSLLSILTWTDVGGARNGGLGSR
jgi:hypothetical protein